jgi:uridine kinase
MADRMNTESPFLIGIAGCSCSGKTYTAEKLNEALGTAGSGVISLDRYYRDLRSIPSGEREKVNFDRPEAVDFDMLAAHLERLLRGETVTIPLYDFVTHTRGPQEEWPELSIRAGISGRKILILEGLHTFYDRRVRDLLQLRIFIETAPGICLSRRIERDVRERGRTERSVREVFERKVMPMYRRFVLPTRKYSDLLLDGSDDYSENLGKIITGIKEII